MATRKTLTREDWVAAGLSLCAEEGFSRVAVEPLATRLGTTKGSFYWHFSSRDDLLTAVLDRWERHHTALVIEDVEDQQPAARLRHLVSGAFGLSSLGERGKAEQAVLAAADHPLVAPVVARVHRARIDYLAELFADSGLPTERAQNRARIAYAAYLGNLQLLGARPPSERSIDALVSEVVALLAN